MLLLIVCYSCNNLRENKPAHNEVVQKPSSITETSLIILGTVQDGGSPHIACNRDCCRELFEEPDKNRKVVSLGIIDPQNNKKYLFDATPDLTEQMKILKEYSSVDVKEIPDGIFLTHAHIGHYTGLMYLGKEAMNSKNVIVYAMPAMKEFLENNGPWSQLVLNHNISIQEMTNNRLTSITSNLNVIPFTVPHRDEYSETIGFIIIGPNKNALFIPDIDKWEKWDRNIVEEISKVDYAFIDATFYDGEEINNRDISEIPHPFIIESMALFNNLSSQEKNKIHFIHFNHTNPALNMESDQVKQIEKNGFNIARIYDVFKL
ncbi:MAG: MBL fold metallo-hydrolase [Ignavibacteriaceae bacterium]|nr:MBL fold metallo-hydrolase [Ignavibacteriaceae bacterium]